MKSTRSIRHVIAISKSQRTGKKDALKTFLISCFFLFFLMLQFLIYLSFFLFLHFHVENFLSVSRNFHHEFIFSMWIYAWLARRLQSSNHRIHIQFLATSSLSSNYNILDGIQCNLKQFHLVFNYIISLLHIYSMIHPPKKKL